MKKINRRTLSLLTIISLTISLVFAFLPMKTEAALRGTTNNATLSLSPDSGLYRTSAAFPIDILVNTHGQNVNAVSVYINFNPSLFSVTVDTTGSVFPTEAVLSVISGKIIITRGIPAIPSPGYINSINAKVATLNITGLTDTVPTADNFTFDFTVGVVEQSSNVFLADTQGTPVLSGVYEGRYSLDGTPPANVSNFNATAGEGQISLSWTNPTSDFNGVKILRKTGSYPTSVTDGTLIYDSNGTSFMDTNLINGTTYYYKAYSRDIVLNYSSGVQVSASPHDTIAPNSITNLSATALTARSIKLDWTAVGDDGNTGTASSYDVRYSTSAITASNFASASQMTGVPAPKANGSAETLTMNIFLGDTTYYFAIKVADESSNTSGISNIVSAKTYRTADLNYNSYVNAQDFSILMSYWGSTARPVADVNQDGYVNAQDFSIMMSQWG